MAIKRLSKPISAEEKGQRLDHVLSVWLPVALGRDLSRATVRRLLMAGAVRVNGRPVRRPAWECAPGDRLSLSVDMDRLPKVEAGREGAPWTVLYEDATLLAVNKPAGVPTHATADPSRQDLFTMVKAALPVASPYLGLHQRLDVDTSGVVLFTREPSANASVSRQFADRGIDKRYHAIVASSSRVPDEWVETARLVPAGAGKRARTEVTGEDGVRAETHFRVLHRAALATLLEASPKTGRKHQIRAHLAGKGLPILGDARYGGRQELAGTRVPRTMLHAWSLTLMHPATGKPLEIRAPYPDDFTAMVAILRGAHGGR